MTIETIEDLAKAFGSHHDEVKAAFAELTGKANEHSARLSDIEQKGARRGGDSGAAATLGSQFIAQPGVSDFAVRNARDDRFQYETKATVTSATTNAPGSAGAGVAPFSDPTIVPLLQRRPAVRDLLPVIQMKGGSVEVVSVAARTSGAAPVAEGGLKPSSDIQLGLRTVPARVIAHWMKASRQILDDLPQLRGLIDTELTDGLALVEEHQLLYGDGTEQNLDGLVPNATDFAAPFTIANPTMLDTLGLALLQSALAEFPASGVILHPSDWTRITLAKNADGDYIMGPPGSAIAPRLWGVPVIVTKAMAADNFLVGDFRSAATLYDRWTARVELGTVNDDFIRNLVTLLAEQRLALAVKQRTALTYGSFGNDGDGGET